MKKLLSLFVMSGAALAALFFLTNNTGSRAGMPQTVTLKPGGAVQEGSIVSIEYTLTEITASGARLSIDDFGTGYASLPMLQKLRASAVCIDRSLIAGVPHDNEQAALARTLISLARGLGLEVVAKGVENNAQREFLADAGCRICQGDLFAPAGPVAEIEPFLRTPRAALAA